MAYLKGTLVGIVTGMIAGVLRVVLPVVWDIARGLASGQSGIGMDLFSTSSILAAVGVGFLVGFIATIWRERSRPSKTHT